MPRVRNRRRNAAVLTLAVMTVSGAMSVDAGPARADANEGRSGPLRRTETAISAGTDDTCAIAADGSAKCWGLGSNGRLGQGDTGSRGNGPSQMGDFLPPISLGSGRAVSAISAGGDFTCALLDHGTVKCWGDGTSGRLGTGNTISRGDSIGEMGDNLAAVDLGTDRTATAISAGESHACALLDNGTVKCWGNNDYGQLGLGNASSEGDGPNEMGDHLPAVDLGTGRTATAISAGHFFTCAVLDDGAVKCWGFGYAGHLGQGSTANLGDGPNEMGDHLPPIDLGSGRTAVAVSAGYDLACALLDNGTVKCWGYNSYGGLGQGNTTWLGDGPNEMGDHLPPVVLGTGRTATAISAGGSHACALLDNGTVKCWGYDVDGELGQDKMAMLGDGPNEMGDFLPPINLGAGRAAIAVTTGNLHTCALLDNGSLKCWGEGADGELGQDSPDNIGDGSGEMSKLQPIALGAGSGSLIVPVLTAPAAPTGLSGTAGLASASLAWTAPLDDGGTTITGYRIDVTTDNGQQWSTTVADTGSTTTTRTIAGLAAGQSVRFRIAAINSRGAGDTSPPSGALLPTAPAVVTSPSTSGYIPLDPARLLDTRADGATIDNQFHTGTALGAGQEIALQVAGRGGVPANATAVVLNVTVTNPTGAGYVTVYPCGATRPNASNLNYTAGQTIPNNVVVKLGTSGTVCLYSQRTTDLVADIDGAFTSGSYTSLDPARLLDTRPDGATIDDQFHTGTALGAGQEIALQVAGRGGVPANAAAVVLNVTVTNPSGAGYVTVYPCGTVRPNASNVNYVVGQSIPNNVVVKLGASGTVCLYSQQTTDLIADINGAFTSGSYTSLDPARLLDTRPDGATIDDQFHTGTALAAGQEIALQVAGRGDVPANAIAVVLNVTVTNPAGAGYVTVYPCGTTRPNASNLNYTTGETIANDVVVELGANGTVCLFSQQTTDLIADINGAIG